MLPIAPSSGWARRPVALSGHALAETYSVLTRLPLMRLEPADAARVITERFEAPFLLSEQAAARMPVTLSRIG